MISHEENSGLKVAEVSSKHFLAWWSYFSFLLPLLCSPPLLLAEKHERSTGRSSVFSDPNSPQTAGHGNAFVMQLIQISKNFPNPLWSKESVEILCEGKGVHPNIFSKLLEWKDGKRIGNVL